jgi:5-methylcytosine-specific restriction enzyme subunit McrC
MPLRTEFAQESSKVTLDISAVEAEALNGQGRRLVGDNKWWGAAETDDLETDRTVCRCDPILGGKWSVAFGDVVGVVAVPGLQVIVRPKIPLTHFVYLLEQTDEWPRMDPAPAALGEEPHFLELLAHWFLNGLADVLRKDLIRDYRPAGGELAAVRGRLEVLPTATMYYSGRLSLWCEYEEFDTDTALNRVLKAAARAIVGNPLLRIDLRGRGARTLARMDEVGELRVGDLDAAVDARTAHYRDALLLAKHILRWTGRMLTAGDALSNAFFIRTPEMIETGLRRLLATAIPTPVFKKAIPIVGSSMTLNPDLIFAPVPAIADVKYRIAHEQWSRPELYQAIAFATGAKVANAAIFSFRKPTSPALPGLKVGDIFVSHICWPANPALTPEEAAQQFVADATAWLATVPGIAAIA